MGVFVGERDVVSVSGPDATTYLQGQISQDVLGLGVGDSAWSLILQPQGKVDAWFRITRAGNDAYLLDVDPGFGETLLARLKRFLLRTKAELDLATWQLHAYDDAHDELAGSAPIVALGADGRGTDVIGLDLDDPTGVRLGPDDHQRRRILAGIPAMGHELIESTIPAEARIVDRSTSFTKGCYTGQELVARVDSRGDNTPRRLRIVQGDGPIPTDTELVLGDSIAGEITSVINDGDGWAGLAYVKRSALDADELELDGAAVSVSLVPADRP
jgi:folate-binding protein YgfZ